MCGYIPRSVSGVPIISGHSTRILYLISFIYTSVRLIRVILISFVQYALPRIFLDTVSDNGVLQYLRPRRIAG
jgi:hypothetical protein